LCISGGGNRASFFRDAAENRSEDIRAQFQTNLFGPIALIQALLPAFRAQGAGHILNVSSAAGLAGVPSFGAYNSSKAALDAFSEALAGELAPLGVRVHVVAPGYFGTDFLRTAKSIRDAAVPGHASDAYATLEQGHGLIDSFHPARIASRQIGDPGKAAERMYEVVTGTGIARGLMDHKEWVRIPLGPDAGSSMRSKLAAITASIDAYEPIWSSTDMDEARLKEHFGI